MALAEPRKRTKLSHDPNNTRWTRDTGGYGHKIMTDQGWRPGDTLGARNASHAGFYTPDSLSHIRVFVKGDNLGLGAKKGSGVAEGECVGLDVFQRLLGRLNGKDEDEITKEQNAREDLKRAIFTEQRWGSIRFVKGGFLIGDKIQELIDGEETRISQLAKRSLNTLGGVSENDLVRGSETQSSKTYKKTKRKRRKPDEKLQETTETYLEKRFKPSKSTTLTQDAAQDVVTTQPKVSKKKRKQSGASKEEVNTANSKQEDAGHKSKARERKIRKEEKQVNEIVERHVPASDLPISQSLASMSGLSSSQSVLGGRHTVRSRNIAQKRLAVMDTASLNQIFMIKQ